MFRDPDLEALRLAYEATPGNAPLLAIYLRALVATDDVALAAAVVTAIEPSTGMPSATRVLAARVLARGNADTRALLWLTGESAEEHLERARVLLSLDRSEEAKAAYRAAIALNATLEDETLRLLCDARPYPAASDRPKLRLISNDDTAREEAEKAIAPEQPQIRFADVGGLDDVKRQIEKRIILPFRKPSLFERFKRRSGGGILLFGPPGCGKTMLARATAGECDARFINVAISDVLDMYIGESERKLDAIFTRAREKTPSVLFFDELEALAAKRQFSRESTTTKIVSHFLSLMDGFAQNNQGVLLLGATNVPWAIDPAFRRPGRFDRVMFVPPPDRAGREAVLKLALAERPVAKGIDVAGLAAKTSGFSGADLAGLVDEAADLAIEASLERGEEVELSQAHLVSALRDARATTSEWLSTARNYARYANDGGQYDEVLAFLDRHAKK